MTRPWTRSMAAQRLIAAVETTPGSGEYRRDERLCVQEVVESAQPAGSIARFSVLLDDAFDAEEARRAYPPDLGVLVMVDDPEPARRQMLFGGFLAVRSCRWDTEITEGGESCIFEAEHVLARAARTPEGWVYGRQVRTGEIEDGLLAEPTAWWGRSVRITALPCVFNPEGVGNRAVVPLTVAGSDRRNRPVHIFTADDGTGAGWDFGTVLRYLVWFHLPRWESVDAGEVFEVTAEAAAGRPVSGDVLARRLARRPISLACEGCRLVEALALFSEACGVYVSSETGDEAGRPRTRLRVWTPGGGPVRSLHLARGGRRADGSPSYDPAGRPVAQILAENNTHRGQARWTCGGAGAAHILLGGVRKYEMTVPLWPGWYPRTHLDDVRPTDRAAAKGLALTAEQVEAAGAAVADSLWFRMYHRQGAEYRIHGDVSRLWVLNEDGAFPGALFNRHAPFDDYRPFDFAAVADASVTRPGGWMRRPRPMQPIVSRPGDLRRRAPWVEVSFDGGITWQQLPGGVRVLEDRAGIWIDCENPTEIVPAGGDPAVVNMWYALVDQRFRVRVTAVFDSDERLTAGVRSAAAEFFGGPPDARVVLMPGSYRFISRKGTVNVLNVQGIAADERDDSPALAELARQRAEGLPDRTIRALPAIPWVETGYRLGDQIAGIRGRDLGLSVGCGPRPHRPVVFERRFIRRQGVYETELTLVGGGAGGET